MSQTKTKKKKAPTATRVDAVVSQLRDASRGRYVWRVQNKGDKSYCMEFPDWKKIEADKWWQDHPSYHARMELARVHVRTSAERLMLKAADMLESMSG